MKIFVNYRSLLVVLFTILFVSQSQVLAQEESTVKQSVSSEKVAEQALNASVQILTSSGDGRLDKQGLGIIVESNGTILTAYNLLKNATQVQVRLRNGEIFDKVDLLNFDERRNVAAIRITATDLPVAPINNEVIEKKEKVYLVANSKRLDWTVWNGTYNSLRLADEIPKAGKGFRVLEFSAKALVGSRGGILTNKDGQVVGLVVSQILTGEYLNYAIPISSVKGLANSKTKLMSFASGSSLELPKPVRKPTAIDVIKANPDDILRNAKIIYVHTYSVLISEKMMITALMKRPEFKKWKMAIVNRRNNADIMIDVEHQLFTFDYRYTVYEPKTQLILMSGKVTVWDGKIASKKFAKKIFKKMETLKSEKPATDSKANKKSKTSSE